MDCALNSIIGKMCSPLWLFVLSIPLTLASWAGPIFPLVVHQLASPLHLASSAVTPAGSVHKSRGNNVVRMWGEVEEMLCVVCCYKWGILMMGPLTKFPIETGY